jgi:hypothetical protein
MCPTEWAVADVPLCGDISDCCPPFDLCLRWQIVVLLTVAIHAKRLNVADVIGSALNQRNHVVFGKLLAPMATRATEPIKSLEVYSGPQISDQAIS